MIVSLAQRARGRCHNQPMRFFNTEGPVRPDDHYAIPPLDRVDERSCGT